MPMYVCLCKGITESDVRQAGRAGHVTPTQLIEAFALKQDGCCGRCAKNIHEFVELANCPLKASTQKVAR